MTGYDEQNRSGVRAMVRAKISRLARVSWLTPALLVCGLAGAQADTSQGFTLHKQPVLERGSGGSWDRGYLDPGTVFYHDNAFHMFYVAIPSWPHPLAIGYARSENGHDWEAHSGGPVLTHRQTDPLPTTSIMSTSALVTEDGTWVLYFTSVAKGEAFYGDIVRATAPGPLGPWTVDASPALSAGPKGAWDELAVGDASVVKSGDGYVMYYAGFGHIDNKGLTEQRANIGMATSTDGITWTKFNDPATTDARLKDSDPVLTTSTSDNAWDTFRLIDPNVQLTPDGWVMAYRGATFNSAMALGLATSEDGIIWTRSSDKPIMTEAEAGRAIIYTTFLSRPDKDYLYIEMGSVEWTNAYLATRSRLSQ